MPRSTMIRAVFTFMLFALTVSTANAGLFSRLCLIESPVRGLNIDDKNPQSFSVEWDFNIPPEIPVDIRVSMNGQDATPSVPWWMLIFDKGAGMSHWGHGVVPGQTYNVTVSQKSVCGKWSSKTIAVTTPLVDENISIDDAIAAATLHVETEISEAPDNIADINDEYTWTETLECDEEDYYCTPEVIDVLDNEREALNIWDPRLEGAQIDSIMDDGQRTYIRTNDLSQVTVYEDDGDGGL